MAETKSATRVITEFLKEGLAPADQPKSKEVLEFKKATSAEEWKDYARQLGWQGE